MQITSVHAMPSPSTATAVCRVNMLLLRHYLRTGCPTTGDDILDDALERSEPGALALVELCAQLRSNKRTRRSMERLRQEQRRRPSTVRQRWYKLFGTAVLSLFRTMRRMSVPRAPALTTLGTQMARRERRALATTGAVVTAIPSLREDADMAAARLWESFPGRQAILWMDNDYRERWGTDPARLNLSLNITAMCVLFLDMDSPGPTTTRSSRIPDFPGHLTTSRVVWRVRDVAALLVEGLAALHHNVRELNAMALGADTIRVPLDVKRTGIRALPWRPCLLSEYQVSSNEDLVALLGMATKLQERSRVALPLLLDENIHYRVMRLLHSTSHKDVDVGDWLSRVPVLYGIWHPYKHLVGVLYRAFLPIIALLEGSGHVHPGDRVVAGRKVLYMEKVFATLLILAPEVRERLEARLAEVRDRGGSGAPGAAADPNRSTSSNAPMESPVSEAWMGQELVVLQGLHTLLYFYCPLIFQLGWKVRQCTWQGRPTQSVKGDVAKQVLHQAFLVMTHVQGDTECKEEYSRTIALALLTWQPWHSKLPFTLSCKSPQHTRLSLMCYLLFPANKFTIVHFNIPKHI